MRESQKPSVILDKAEALNLLSFKEQRNSLSMQVLCTSMNVL